MQKPEYLPFSVEDEITIGQALETCEFLATQESELNRALTSVEIHVYLTGNYEGPFPYDLTSSSIVNKVGRIASRAMGPVRYKSPNELAAKINMRRNELNLL